jgi:hypothetical protein
VLALATVGAVLVLITTSSLDAVQTPLEIVHFKVAVPLAARPVTPEVLLAAVVMVAAPLTNVQRPVPVVGLFPFRVAVVAPQIF